MNFTPEEIAHLREIVAKATKRPWWHGQHQEETVDELSQWIGEMPAKHDGLTLWMVGAGVFGEDRNEDEIRIPAITGNGPTSEANMDFIISAVNTHEAALDLIEQQRAEIERLRKAGKAAFILIREQLDIMDDEDAEEIMNDLHTAIEGGAG